MDNCTLLTTSPCSGRNSNDDIPRVKILCSFNGSILPRPQDGKLRYVGGETRILSVARDIGFEELMVRMKELFEGASVLKYKQPDEDLDALVSVVNDDDVTNMMEEYDKLGSGDGFTRLRIFLFSNSELDDPLHFLDVNGRDNERRYVDALNSLNDSPEFGKQHMSEFQGVSPVDDVQLMEQYFNRLNLEGGIHNPRNFEMPMSPVNTHHLTIPHLGSLLHPQTLTHRYSDMEPPRSPAYYSPRHPANDFPTSPSCSCYPYGEPNDRIFDRIPSEDYYRQHHANYLPQIDQQSPENVSWLQPPSISGEKTGFPNNILHGTNIFEGNNVCDHCHPPFPRNQTPDFPHSFYTREQNDPRPLLYPDSHHMPLPYIHHRHEFGNEMFHDQPMARYGNVPYGYGPENVHHASSNGHVPANSFYVQSTMHGSPSKEAPISPHQENGIPRLQSEVVNQNPLVESTPKLSGYDGADIPDLYPVRPLKLLPNSYNLEDHHVSTEPVHSIANSISFSKHHGSTTLVEGRAPLPNILQNTKVTESLMKIEGKDGVERKGLNGELSFPGRAQKNIFFMESDKAIDSNCLPAEQVTSDANSHGGNPPEKGHLSYIPPFVESVKKAALEAGEVKDEAQEGVVSATENAAEVREEATHELDVVDAPEDLELDSDTGTESNSKIEPTKAEEEAIAKGLQTIKNDDLEEIRQLGTGTYGAVYHGKWKGSDVAIKRIKASCFAGKPSERERMIADFWKEALMLSSLHHPNVVAFYGIVRDGPDGSLATVTEYMINGSLKQFLKKKDRTIDRRKRLIIAMDTAFGMEYLHGKNIVHFDLKCENLLVNMRDPHRPICKIGDLGLSKVKQQTMVSGGVRGTLPWMAPELLSGKCQMVTEKIDVYSFGIVMWELLTGDEPYTNMHCASIIGGIVNGSLRPTIPTWCDPEWKSLMESCWSADPQERPSFLEISQKLRTMAAAIIVK